MLKKFVFALLLSGLALPVAAPAQPVQPAQSDQPAVSSLPAPDSGLTARFSSFFSDILNGRVPTRNISSQVKNGLTAQLIGQIRGSFATLGTFHRLEFVRADEMQGYRRYHYSAVFDKGNQGVMFIVDSNNTIVGFFQDPGQ